MLRLPNFAKPGWWIQLVDGMLTPQLDLVAGLLVMAGFAVRVGMASSADDLAARLPSIVAGGLLPGFVY
ncbi:MAG: hypothetical protein GY953_47395, partial [bacterium]|nr:hypothetical protein [bacterium]